MDTTLVLLTSYNSIQMFLASDTVTEINLTGGYKSGFMPLSIHYVDSEWMIGNEAYEFDLYEQSYFYENIRKCSEKEINDYFKTLYAKIISIYHDQIFGSLCFIDCEAGLFKTLDLSVFSGISKSKCYYVSYGEAIAYYNEYWKEDKIDCVNIVDGNYMYKLGCKYDGGSYRLSESIKESGVEALRKTYLNLIGLKLFNKSYSKMDLVSKHQILQLYISQLATLYKQLMNKSDVKLYSSIVFPPKQIMFEYVEIEKIHKKLMDTIQETSEKCMIIDDLPFIKEQGINGEGQVSSDVLIKGAALKGQGHLVKTVQDTLGGARTSKKEFMIRDNSGKEKVIVGSLREQGKFEIDIIITGKGNKLYVDDYELTIENAREKLNRVILYIEHSKSNQIKEVNYELRRL